MVLVPSFIELDGLVVVLGARSANDCGLPQVYQCPDPDRPALDALVFLTTWLLSHGKPAEVLDALEQRQRLSDGHAVGASPVIPGQSPESSYDADVKNWEQLTGTKPALGDAYRVGASFLEESIVIPRSTFIKLMTKLYELNDEVRAGRIDPRLDQSMPIPPPKR